MSYNKNSPLLSPILMAVPSAPELDDIHISDTDSNIENYNNNDNNVNITCYNEDEECRFQCGSVTNLIAPCLCSGTNKYICRKCLDDWRASNVNPKAFTHCTQCNFEYQYDLIDEDPRRERIRWIKYSLYLTRDVFTFAIINEALILLITMITLLSDHNKTLLNSLPILHNYHFIIYHIYAILFYFGLIGFFGIIIYFAKYSSTTRHNNTCMCCWDVSDVSDLRCCVGCMLITFIIFVIFGIFIGIYTTIDLFYQKSAYHKQKLWKQQEVKKYIVRDLNGQNIV